MSILNDFEERRIKAIKQLFFYGTEIPKERMIIKAVNCSIEDVKEHGVVPEENRQPIEPWFVIGKDDNHHDR